MLQQIVIRDAAIAARKDRGSYLFVKHLTKLTKSKAYENVCELLEADNIDD